MTVKCVAKVHFNSRKLGGKLRSLNKGKYFLGVVSTFQDEDKYAIFFVR